MTSFKNAIKRRLLWVLSFSGLACIVSIAAIILKNTNRFDSMISTESLVGFLVGILIISSYRVKMYYRALKSKELLEELYINETDERNRVIALKTSQSTIYMALTLLGIGGIVMSFINHTVFLTIGVLLIFILVIYGIMRIYYSRKY